MLGLMFHIQALRDDHNKHCIEFKDSAADMVIPSYSHPLPVARVLPDVLCDEANDRFIDIAKRLRDVKGIVINTFIELESYALLSLSSDGKIPPVYPVGPVLNVKNDDNNDEVDSKQSKQKSDILKWLDDQPPSSVVFLCFGSRGSFTEDQVKEIARALEQGGFRFLWSLRQPPPRGNNIGVPSDYTDPAGVLPEGFLDRTAEVGKVIVWAPQVAILAHPAVGGFVSHCGWNSTLESLWFGVPVATWPLYAEQQLNAFQLVKELEIAMEIDMGYRKDGSVVVTAEKIESGIKKLMELDSDIRKRVKQISDNSKKALMDGGSSYASLGHFIDQI